MKRFITILTAALLISLMLCACTAAPKEEATPPATQAPASPEATMEPTAEPTVEPTAEPTARPVFGQFTAFDLDGNAVDYTVLEGHKLTMVNIWATFCGPCISEMPHLGELAAEYADKGVQIMGIVLDAADEEGNAYPDYVEEAKVIINDTGANYLHILPSASLWDAWLWNAYVVPTTVFLDENGMKVGKVYQGSMSKEDWAAVMDDMLAQVG